MFRNFRTYVRMGTCLKNTYNAAKMSKTNRIMHINVFLQKKSTFTNINKIILLVIKIGFFYLNRNNDLISNQTDFKSTLL